MAQDFKTGADLVIRDCIAELEKKEFIAKSDENGFEIRYKCTAAKLKGTIMKPNSAFVESLADDFTFSNPIQTRRLTSSKIYGQTLFLISYLLRFKG